MFEDIFSENPDHMGEGWVVGVGVPGWVSPLQFSANLRQKEKKEFNLKAKMD